MVLDDGVHPGIALEIGEQPGKFRIGRLRTVPVCNPRDCVRVGNFQRVQTVGVDPTITIPSLRVTLDTGNKIKSELAGGVTATLSQGDVGTDNTARWLLGEDSTAAGLTGALRDMYTPACYGDPGKVSDEAYTCGTADSGGVHSNSGVPNHI